MSQNNEVSYILNEPIVWEGDLDDDCTVRDWHGMMGRAEAMSEWSWFCCVYRGKETLMHNSTDGFNPNSGESARKLVEMYMRLEALRGLVAPAPEPQGESREEEDGFDYVSPKGKLVAIHKTVVVALADDRKGPYADTHEPSDCSHCGSGLRDDGLCHYRPCVQSRSTSAPSPAVPAPVDDSGFPLHFDAPAVPESGEREVKHCCRRHEGETAGLFERRFIVCPKCGNKRCNKAQWCGYVCTGSNDVKQPEPVEEPKETADVQLAVEDAGVSEANARAESVDKLNKHPSSPCLHGGCDGGEASGDAAKEHGLRADVAAPPSPPAGESEEPADEWMPFDGDYEKLEYDVLLRGGEQVDNCYPNAGMFQVFKKGVSTDRAIGSGEVEFVRLASYPTLGLNDDAHEALANKLSTALSELKRTREDVQNQKLFGVSQMNEIRSLNTQVATLQARVAELERDRASNVSQMTRDLERLDRIGEALGGCAPEQSVEERAIEVGARVKELEDRVSKRDMRIKELFGGCACRDFPGQMREPKIVCLYHQAKAKEAAAQAAELSRLTTERDRLAGQLAATVENYKLTVASWNAEDSRLRQQLAETVGALKVANLKNAHSLANNLCPDHRDKQQGKPCLACEIERLRAGEAEVRQALVAMFVDAISGMADAAIINADQTYDYRNTAAAVRQLSEEHKKLRLQPHSEEVSSLTRQLEEARGLIGMYPEFHACLDQTACPDGWVECPICEGGGSDSGKKNKPTHKPGCPRGKFSQSTSPAVEEAGKGDGSGSEGVA